MSIGYVLHSEEGKVILQGHKFRVVIEQLRGNFKVRQPELLPLYDEVLRSRARFRYVQFTWKDRSHTKLADAQAEIAMRTKSDGEEKSA